MIVNDNEKIKAVQSQFQLVVRGMYSNPPCHGARIVSAVLNNQCCFDEWFVYIFDDFFFVSIFIFKRIFIHRIAEYTNASIIVVRSGGFI